MQVQNTFRQNEILFYALLVGQVLVGGMLRFVLLDSNRSASSEYSTIVTIVLITCFVLTLFFRKRASDTIPLTASPAEKMDHFRKYLILQAAFLEGANMIILLLAFMDNNSKYLPWFVVGVVGFLTLRPNKLKFQEEYKMTPAEFEQVK